MPPTAVRVDELRVDEADFEVVQHSWLMEVAECREVILPHQDVWVSQVRQVLHLGVQLVLDVLRSYKKQRRDQNLSLVLFHAVFANSSLLI